MENLKKVLRITGLEYPESIDISHSDFISGLSNSTITYKLPKRFINIFYRIPKSAFKQILIQVFLLSMWGGIGFSIFFLVKKQWIFAAIAIVLAFVIKKIANILMLIWIKRALIKDKTFFENLLSNKIIGVYLK
jgi:hypothetical protein